MNRTLALATALALSPAVAPAHAGGWSAPVFDVPPPLSAATPAAVPAGFDPWAPIIAAGLLLILVAGQGGGSDRVHAHPAPWPDVPEDPPPAPVALPGSAVLLIAGVLNIGSLWAITAGAGALRSRRAGYSAARRVPA